MARDSYYLDARVAAAYDAEHAESRIAIDDIPFYVDLAKEAAAAGHRVLELACGTGRVTIPIADAGVGVTGVDRSPAMLDVARQKTAGRGNPVWTEGDMTSFEAAGPFGLVIIPFRSFLHLIEVGDQKACLRRIHDHLLPGGRLALNFFNPNLTIIGAWQGAKRGALERMGPTTWETREYTSADQVLHETRIEETLSDDNAVISRVYRNLRIRYVFRYEMEHLLALCGFEVEALYGWFDRRPFTEESEELVWIARKPA